MAFSGAAKIQGTCIPVEIRKALKGELKLYPARKKQSEIARRLQQEGGISLPEILDGKWVQKVEGALESLPSNYRQLVELKYFHRLSTVQLASKLHISERTVFVWEQNALLQIATALGKLKNQS